MNPDNHVVISHLYRSAQDGRWVVQTNDEHAEGVADLAAKFASEFGLSNWGKLMGLLHDRGKERADFQRFIRINSGYDPDAGRYDDKNHSHIGALLVEKSFRDKFHLMSNAVAGHHRGLYDCDSLEPILRKSIPNDVDAEAPNIRLEIPQFKPRANDMAHLARVLFSCLTDADYLDTERFMTPEDFAARTNTADMRQLKTRLDDYLSHFQTAPDTPLNRLRTQVQNICRDKSGAPSGFYEFTVPTGGGKTIASMVWAINHAIAHGKKRVVIAIPYTSIIIQTADVLRKIFGDENVLEHHSVVDEERLSHKNKLAAENWDSPIVVTTNVQLFESMFANKPGKCRKLHSLCNSVVILDEVQNLPLSFLQPIVDALDSYVRLFGMSVLLCTASQPTLSGDRKGLGTAMFHGLKSDVAQIIPSSMRLHDKLRRVSIKMPSGRVALEDLANRIVSHRQVLCIVNTRRLAAELFDLLPRDETTIHLSRMMCPKHIRETIERVRKLLKDDCDNPVRVISTQLIEAGVDIDFPVVYRQLAGLDSILQAAGRCNREGKAEEGTTYVFDLQNFVAIGLMGSAANAMRQMLSMSPGSDWLSPDTMTEYFRILYGKTPSFDKENISYLTNNPQNISFETAARKFRLIDENGVSVIVNYGRSSELVDTLRRYGPSRNLVRQLGQYSVTVRQSLLTELCRAGAVEEPWEGFFYIPNQRQYDPMIGLKSSNEYIEETFVI